MCKSRTLYGILMGADCRETQFPNCKLCNKDKKKIVAAETHLNSCVVSEIPVISRLFFLVCTQNKD